MEENTLLHDTECEKIVLGTILTYRNAFDDWKEYLNIHSFYDFNNQEVYKACCRINERGEEISIVSVLPELMKAGIKADGIAYYVATLPECASTSQSNQYPARLSDLEKRRRMWAIGQKLVRAGISEADDLYDVYKEVTDELSKFFMEDSTNILDLHDTITQVYDQIRANLSNSAITTGTPTGFPRLDEKGGFHGSDLIIVGGESSNGKTSFAQSVVANAINNGSSVAFYSMEMTAMQLTVRMLSMQSGISSSTILYGRPNEFELAAIDKAVGQLAGKTLLFDERSTSNIDTIINSIRMMKKRFNICGAVVDYLQILSVNSRMFNKEQQMGEAARRLKNLAKELDIWVVALSQLNRDKDNPEPNINRMRDSGQIAEAADVVILVYRPEKYGKRYSGDFSAVETKDTALIDVAKGRNIGTFKFICGFNAPCTKFYPLDDGLPIATPIEEDAPF